MILAFFCAIFVISYAGSSRRASQKWQTVRRRQRQAWKREISITSYEGRHISIGKELNSVMTVRGVPTDEITLEVKKDRRGKENDHI